MFSPTPMAHRWQFVAGDSYKDFTHAPSRWAGAPAVAPVFFNPKLRCNAALKSFGFWAENPAKGFNRADVRTYYLGKALTSISRSTIGQGGSPTMAVPAVFSPTSQANRYGGRSMF